MSTLSPQEVQQIASLPPSALKSIPAAAPPPGVQPNFGNPDTLVPAVLGVGTAFLALALFCFSLRIYSKLRISRNASWDDCKITNSQLDYAIAYVLIVPI